MDNQQAKFLLSSFRPDGADAGSADFAEALKLAAEDRELGEWLAQERAADAAFAEALSEVTIPEGLRDEILAVLEYDGHDLFDDNELENLFTESLADIAPPEGLREQILASMAVEQTAAAAPAEDKITDISAWRWLSVAGVAAAVAVAVFFTQGENTGQENALAQNGSFEGVATNLVQPVAVKSATMQMAALLSDTDQLALNTEIGGTVAALSYLQDHQSPVPAQLPPGLENAKLVGCKNVFLDNGRPVSLMCFEKEGLGMVHLISLNQKDLSDADQLSSMQHISLKDCYGCKRTNFNITHWSDGEMTYMVLTKAEKQQMAELF